jgi:hypothetical protein
MVWTARDAELLKQEAGFRGGGRSTASCPGRAEVKIQFRFLPADAV